jgi:hypothetical protein
VLGDGSDQEMLYLRFCDDMIILHTDKKKCDAALKRYMSALKELGFVAHEPERMRRYGAGFFAAKSKAPYRIGRPSDIKSASPWVSFLGYQIGHDGQLRVKKESLDRHKEKHRELVSKVIRYMTRPRARPVVTNDDIVEAVAFRLVAAGIGKSGLSRQATEGSPRCWMSAFELLARTPAVTAQMRRLDQHRDRLLSRLIGTLKVFHPTNYSKDRLDAAKPDGNDLAPKRPLIGRALSYCGRIIGDAPRRLWARKTDDRGYGREY